MESIVCQLTFKAGAGGNLWKNEEVYTKHKNKFRQLQFLRSLPIKKPVRNKHETNRLRQGRGALQMPYPAAVGFEVFFRELRYRFVKFMEDCDLVIG